MPRAFTNHACPAARPACRSPIDGRFVTSLALPRKFPAAVISADGNGELRLWNYNSGDLLQTLSTAALASAPAAAAATATAGSADGGDAPAPTAVSTISFCDINNVLGVLLDRCVPWCAWMSRRALPSSQHCSIGPKRAMV